MVKYEWSESYDENDNDSELLRNGRVVASFGYSDITDCCRWWYVGPGGDEHKNMYADADMSRADVRRMVMEAYDDGPDQVEVLEVLDGERADAKTEAFMAADFRARREMAGISQRQLADELGIDVRTVKRWEAKDGGSVSHAAWEIVDDALDTQTELIDYALDAVGKMPEDTFCVILTYYRSQAQYDAHGGGGSNFTERNANVRAVAIALRAFGYGVLFKYPDDAEADATIAARSVL